MLIPITVVAGIIKSILNWLSMGGRDKPSLGEIILRNLVSSKFCEG